MERIVVSDTNIFIDLVELGILADLFYLPWQIHTTDFVMDELTDATQFDVVNSYCERGRLTVGMLTPEEVGKLFQMSSSPGCKISPADFSVILYAQKANFNILTGDKQLRTYAEKEGIEVHGILFIFEALVEHSILPPALATELLQKLKELNKRTPAELIEALIKKLERMM